MSLTHLAVLCALSQQATPAFRDLDYAGAVAAATAEQKPLFLDFCSGESNACQRLVSSTWPSPIMQHWLQVNCVAIHVDRVADAATLRRYEIATFPTLLLANFDGAEIERLSGFFEEMELIAELKPLIRGAEQILAARALVRADPKSPFAHWDLGRAFRVVQIEKRALDELLLAWDLGAELPDFRALRDGPLAFELASLVRANRQAQRAMRKRRDEQHARLLAPDVGANQLQVACELALLNDCLGEARATYELRGELARRAPPPPPAVLQALFTDRVAALLHAERRYGDLLEGRGDTLLYLDRLIQNVEAARRAHDEQRNHALEFFDEAPQESIDPFATQIELSLATCGIYFEALVGGGKSTDARAALESLITLAPTGSNFARLISAASRAGDLEFAREIGERGLKHFKEKDDLQFVRQALSNVGKSGRRF